jgi:hypothetical protein
MMERGSASLQQSLGICACTRSSRQAAISAIPQVTGRGDPDYERAIDIVHDAAIRGGVKLCGPWAWRDRPDFICFQAGNEMAAVARGVKAELGEFADTQPSPKSGPSPPRGVRPWASISGRPQVGDGSTGAAWCPTATRRFTSAAQAATRR